MKTINILFRMTVLLSLVLGALAVTPTPTVFASTPDNDVTSKGVSPETHLNPDGTLKLGANFSGSFDIKNWDVQLDPALGPVFSPIATQDNWAAVGTGGGAFTSYVNSILVNGTDVYVGGGFRDLDGIPEADYIARWDGTQWNALSNNAAGNGALSGAPYTMTFFGGELYVGGFFNALSPGNVLIAKNLAKWNGSAWSVVGGLAPTAINSIVEDLAIFDDTSISNNDILYIGGFFTDLNSIPEADYVAMYNISANTWSSMGDNGVGNGSLTNIVGTVSVDTATGEVYVGGFFTDADGIAAADYIAKWDGANWSGLGNSSIPNAGVYEILVADSTHIYVSGNFTDVDGIAAADYIAKWNGTAWSALGSYSVTGNGALDVGNATSAFNPASGIVESMQLNGGALYVAGNFNMADPALAAGKHLAKYDTGTDTWSIVDDNGANASIFGTSGAGIHDLAISSGRLYIGGEFSDINDDGTLLPTADYFASMTLAGDVWSAYGNQNGVFNNEVDAIVAMGTDVYVAGNFVNAGGDARIDSLARWDGTKWNPVGNANQSFGSLPSSVVYALAVDGTDLYVGGTFNYVSNNGTPVDNAGKIAKWDTLTQTWSALGFGASATADALNNTVYSIAILGNDVYAGGAFTDVNDQGAVLGAADYIARWNKTDGHWYALAGNGSSNGALNNSVRALAVYGTDLYAGGVFTNVVDTSNAVITNAPYLAKWDGTNWSAVPGTTTAFSNSINALTYSDQNMYVGGNFGTANGVVGASYIAVWNQNTQIWSALGNSPLNQGVTSIAVAGADVYVGGTFSNVKNSGVPIPEADRIAKWNGSNWSALGSNGASDGALNSIVYALAVIQNDVWVGGNFQNINNNGAVLKEADALAMYGLDVPPTISSVNRTSATPTNLASMDFTVTFSESVTGVDAGDFSLTTSGVSGAAVSGVSGTGSVYTVTVNTGSGNGTIRLNVADDDTIIDVDFNPLGGAGTGNGNFTSGQIYTVIKSATFADAPLSYWANSYIERLYNAGVTGGCGVNPLIYCPDVSVTRAQMAVFLLRGMHGSAYSPPAVGSSTDFTDVSLDYWAAAWIKQLALEGITSGCGPGVYCPEASVTRDQMAVFLLRAEHGSSYIPPAVTGTFQDVPTNHWAAAWIEQLYTEGITGGCGTDTYCPSTPVTRAQMAVFLVRTFNLP